MRLSIAGPRPHGPARSLFRWFVVVILATSAGGIVDATEAAAAANRPDIVVLYMDDFSPLADWLWSDSHKTPALARFVTSGVTFRHASGSTPRCCPAEANVLTGRYGHNNGVTRNDPGRLDLRGTVNRRLQRAGYHTVYVGKYFNRLAHHAPTRRAMRRFAYGWDAFDVIWENQGRSYDYDLYTKSRTLHFGAKPRDHSSHVIGRRVARHIRAAPRDERIFVMAHPFDGHPPLLPMPRFRGSSKCRRVAPWRGPAYNESDVSDKPAYVRRTRPLQGSAYRLTRRCEVALDVDWVASRIQAALRDTGRLRNTLFVFTADNGWLMGDHRLTRKNYPYATPVPLYMLWPARLGTDPRVVDEPVSNVDLAPTFCALAGCRMPRADGMDLRPLLLGTADHLDRCFLYEEMLHAFIGAPRQARMPAWYGIRTTLGCPQPRWHACDLYLIDCQAPLWVYTEYRTGAVELYNLTIDPYQLRNRAGEPAYARVQAALRRRLHGGVVTPDRVRFRRAITPRE